MNTLELKQYIQKQLVDKLSQELEKAKSSHLLTKEYSESDDLKQEGKYDTRAIEANYLKDAQARRVFELEAELNSLKCINIKEHHKAHIGSIIRVEEDGRAKSYFISPAQPLGQISIDNETIHIITHSSPVGEQLLNLEAGEGFELELANQTREIEIIEIL